MSKKRKNHSPTFKAKVALAAAKGNKTLAQLSSEFGIHQSQIGKWKQELLDNASTLFESKADKAKKNEVDCEKLHAKIGQLTMENDFLAKVLGR
ncbi:transposase [Shewanella sp. NFH-SH190041]|uniref:helix-turn-helix domain-containing protein n=1 Tax=Shewanella sp. NFH-SH190041 TaxID=2950245 RepID=UPI0021C25790|nr:helix-turn-helix domain-containing protein [Shewanella sp. NFH-SH190041]BDM63569.1 transposase [Shewanella sp. NFH-SH190041]BDM63708.1 transposase [Shewanella sp. NFH-SH190041]BDM64162.1 transposase [Shewanella sp. NFH-SH190041]BDM64591.1 transposase [Shewanella sp. NFH-SH190041]BDM64705.1 transposase [Shewanella sp. NFH-SH190041]